MGGVLQSNPSAVAVREVRNGETLPKVAKCKHVGEKTGEVWPPKDGLGDAVERTLSAIGITKERWAAVTGAAKQIHADDDASCSGCERRQRRWNYVGRILGIGKSNDELKVIQDAYALDSGAHLPLYSCGVHGVCVMRGRKLEAIEGAPMSCTQCIKEGLGYEAG